jgi:hypothetical protein
VERGPIPAEALEREAVSFALSTQLWDDPALARKRARGGMEAEAEELVHPELILVPGRKQRPLLPELRASKTE